jgi:hypothetical protein
MYTKLDSLDNIYAEAAAFVLANDRSPYNVFFEAAERFCAENQVLIGGQSAINTIIDAPITISSYVYELYCADTLNTCRRLADALAAVKSPHVPADTVMLQTNIKHREFTIYVNARNLFKVYAIGTYRGINLIDIITCEKHKGRFATDIMISCIDVPICIIDVYRTLQLPSKISKWATALDNESKLAAMMKGNDGVTAPNHKKIPWRKIMDCLSNTALVGDYALSLYNKNISGTRLQIVSMHSLDDIAATIGKLMGVKLHYVSFHTNLPSDFQLIKYTIYNDKTAICDVYNVATYEMVPVTHIDGISCASIWTILRLLYVDIWMLKIVSKLTGQINYRIEWLMHCARVARTNIDLLAAFPMDFIGVYINEAVVKKKLMGGEMFPPYYPVAKILSQVTAGGDDSNRDWYSGDY